MARLYFRLAVALNIGWALALVVIRVIPCDDRQMQAFVTAPENCQGACILGMIPGRTTVGEALDRLQSHPWVDSVELETQGTGYSQIRWGWSGRQPDFVDVSHLGRITFYWATAEGDPPDVSGMAIETISIYTRIRMYSLQTWYSAPESGTATIRPDGALGYSAAYHMGYGTLVLSTVMACPADLMSYWNAPTRMLLSIGHGTSVYVPPLEMVKLC